jgi:hypothetical protein
LLSLFIFISGSLYAQNPDGQSASLHITPSWLWGSANYDRVSPIRIPPTQISDGYFVNVRDTGVVQYPTSFGLDVMLKIPTASFLTMSVTYSYIQRFEEIYTPYNIDNIYYYWSLKGGVHRVSITASIYNLFSIY